MDIGDGKGFDGKQTSYNLDTPAGMQAMSKVFDNLNKAANDDYSLKDFRVLVATRDSFLRAVADMSAPKSEVVQSWTDFLAAVRLMRGRLSQDSHTSENALTHVTEVFEGLLKHRFPEGLLEPAD